MKSEKIARMLKRFGDEIKIKSESQESVGFGFIQPLRYKNKIYLGDKFIEAGACNGGHFLLISTLDTRLNEFDDSADISFSGKSYGLKSSEIYYDGGKPLYIWAIVYKKIE